MLRRLQKLAFDSGQAARLTPWKAYSKRGIVLAGRFDDNA